MIEIKNEKKRFFQNSPQPTIQINKNRLNLKHFFN